MAATAAPRWIAARSTKLYNRCGYNPKKAASFLATY
jgi:hypothetical protein